jgi:hypothetical protein
MVTLKKNRSEQIHTVFHRTEKSKVLVLVKYIDILVKEKVAFVKVPYRREVYGTLWSLHTARMPNISTGKIPTQFICTTV